MLKKKQFHLLILIITLAVCFPAAAQPADNSQNPGENILTPEAHFGFKPGANRMIFDYGELIGYLKKVAAQSDRLLLREIGTSPMGKTMYVACISTGENIENIDTLRQINRRLALDPDIPAGEMEHMLTRGKVFLLTTLSMHSNEIGPTQAAPLMVYDLVTTRDPKKLEWLNNVVFLMIPCHNPDGLDLIAGHYRKYKGTKYETTSLPGIYHKYIGHDNNRDFITLSQEDSRAISRVVCKDYFPQVLCEKHQMSSTGVRYFVPTNHDPIAQNIDEDLWNWSRIFGAHLMKDMTADGLAGVTQNYQFDNYWPGSTETSIWKNVISMLTEASSARHATPIFVEENELRVNGKGLSEYKKSINMPLPWKGGWWGLTDIVAYELSSIRSIIKTASNNKKAILQSRNHLCKKEIAKGKTQPPYYYICPLKQHDQSELVRMVNLLKEHGVDIYHLTGDHSAGGRVYQKGDIVIPLAQPYRAFIKEVMEHQQFPVRHYTPKGKLIKPYDITSWSLPLHMNVSAHEINTPVPGIDGVIKKIPEDFLPAVSLPESFRAAVFTANHNESFKAAFLAQKIGLRVERLAENLEAGSRKFPKGSFIIYWEDVKASGWSRLWDEITVTPGILSEPVDVPTRPFNPHKVALVESFLHDKDAGWTRYLFDSYHIQYKVVRPRDFKNTDFSREFDVVVFPDERKSSLMKEKKDNKKGYGGSRNYPPEYTKGIGPEGMEKLMTFLDHGGIVLSWGRSTALFMGRLTIKRKRGKGKGEDETFKLPIRDISEDLKKSGLYCPGSLLQVHLLEDHPLTWGMPEQAGIFSRGKPVFRTSIPNFDMDRRGIAKISKKKVLLSGYCEGADSLKNRTVMAWLKKGKGQIILYGFAPQFRASTPGTYKLLFNALLIDKISN